MKARLSVPVKVFWTDTSYLKITKTGHYQFVPDFPDHADEWARAPWTMRIDFDVPPAVQGIPSAGMAYFVTRDGPEHLLVPQTRFVIPKVFGLPATVIIEPN